MAHPMKVAPEGAGRYDHLHGDEDAYWPTAAEEALIEQLADQKLTARLYDDAEQFNDLLAGIEPSDYEPQLQRALRNLDRACKGDRASIDAVLTAVSQIQRTFKNEAERVWLDDIKDEAAGEILGLPA